MPNADRFQLHIYAALAEQERAFISQRTKQALAAAKSRGIALGVAGPANLRRNIEDRRAAADEFAQKLAGTLNSFMSAGLPQRVMVARLNELRVGAPRGGSWSLSQLQRVLSKL